MAFIDWSEALSVSVEEVDADHKRLVGMVNGIHDELEKKADKDALSDLLEELLSYTSWHFRHEERLMQEASFEGLFDHKKEHEDLVRQATGLYEAFLDGDDGVPGRLMPFLKEWLTNHIIGTDKKMGVFLAGASS